MLHGSKDPITLPNYSDIKHLEGKGNYAIKKYYDFPISYFYKHKLRMIVDLIGDRKYCILDFGSGPGIFYKELKKHADIVIQKDINDRIDPLWKFDAIICGSVLEFCDMDKVLPMLKQVLNPNGSLIISSVIDTKLTRAYFRLIKDTHSRHNHKEITSKVSRYFKINSYNEWLGLYFSIRASK